jgi:hypothetical protein
MCSVTALTCTRRWDLQRSTRDLIWCTVSVFFGKRAEKTQENLRQNKWTSVREWELLQMCQVYMAGRHAWRAPSDKVNVTQRERGPRRIAWQCENDKKPTEITCKPHCTRNAPVSKIAEETANPDRIMLFPLVSPCWENTPPPLLPRLYHFSVRKEYASTHYHKHS